MMDTREMRAGLRMLAPMLGLAILAGCGQEHGHARQSAAPPVSEVHSASAQEALWHLRAGLNVAALECRGRGRVPVAATYGHLLSHHRALLDAAYHAEQRRYGPAEFDRHQTRIYNSFAGSRSPERFCRAAAGIAREALAMNDEALVPASPRLLAMLERP